MKIACEACGAKYTIADDKVRGRKVKIRCKGCGTPIVVDGQQGGGGSISDAETDAALEPENGAVTWSVNLSDTDSRTMSLEEIIQGYAAGVVTADAFVWKDGMADWVPILESEVAPLLTGGTPVASPEAVPAARATAPMFTATAPNQATAAARPAATRAQSQPDNTADLFGAIDVAGAEEDVATSAPVIPQAGTSAYGDGNMTGARNENSVLFSLDALKAGFSPSAPAAKPAPKAPKSSSGGRAQQASNPDDPFGMGASAGLGGGVLFGTDNQALLNAPAPPPPAPVLTPMQVATGVVPVGQHARGGNNKLVLIFAAIGGVVIIGLLLALLLGRKHEDSTASAEPSGSVNGSAGAAPVAAAAEEKKPDAPASKADEPAASATPTATASATAAPETKPAEKAVSSGAVAVAKTSADTAKKKEEAVPAVPAGASDLPPFSKSSAISGLTAASMAANACRKPGGPTGPGKATVTFAPSGRVTTATVSGSYAGTAVGGCVASGFRKAHVPPFSGAAVTVSKSFAIN